VQSNKLLIIVDCDGVLTDYKCYYSPEGKLFKVFDSRDSYAIKNLHKLGVFLHILSSDVGSAKIIEARAAEWEVPVSVAKDKAVALRKILKKYPNKKVIYIGNGPEDLACIDLVDYFYAPIDSCSEVLNTDDEKVLILKRRGGEGILEEVQEQIQLEIR